MLLLGSTVMLLLTNSVWLMSTFSSSQCCSKISMQWLGKWTSFVSIDFSDTAKQLNKSEVSLQVTGRLSRVCEEMVQFVDIQDSLCGQYSVMDMFPFNLIMKVWNKASVEGLEVAFMEEWAQQVLPTI